MKLEDTIIEEGGVTRCCLHTVASEYEGKDVNLGDTSKCKICGESFTLIKLPPGMITAFRDRTKPVWKPDWQIQADTTANK